MIFSRFLIAVSLLLISRIGLADDNAETTSQDSEINQQILQLKQSNKVYEKVIKNLIQRIEKLEDSAAGDAVSIKDEKEPDEDLIDPEFRARLEEESRENTKLIQTAFEQRLSKEGGMLLGQYQFIYEPGLSYVHSSYDKIVVDGFTIFPILVIGDIVSEKVDRDIFFNNHSFRLGVGRDMQVDIVIPIGYEEESSFRGDGSHESKKISGLGDISLGLSHQLIKFDSDWPDTVIAFNWKSTTGQDPYRLVNSNELALGSGFDTFGFSIFSMISDDPSVLFGGLSLNYTQADDKEIGRVKPGISGGLNLGMALALNFNTSLSFNFQYAKSGRTEVNGQKINGTETTTGAFTIGLSTAKGQSYAVDVDLGIGLTADSPDFQLTVSFPFKFSTL
jgi:hypothetical protein